MAVRATGKRPLSNDVRGIGRCFVVYGPERCTARDWERFSDDGGTERFETMMTRASAIDSTQKMVK